MVDYICDVRLTLPQSLVATSPSTWPASLAMWEWWGSSSPGPLSSSRSLTMRAELVCMWLQLQGTMIWFRSALPTVQMKPTSFFQHLIRSSLVKELT